MVEKQLILRLPEALAASVQQMLNENKLNGKMEIKLGSASEGTFTIDGVKINPCYLVELPCVIESQKSFDQENFYKSSDIHQMLLVTEPGEPPPNARFPSGLTPPTKQVRVRRFERFPPPPPASIQETEKTLQLISTKEEVVSEEVKVEEIEEDIPDEWEADEGGGGRGTLPEPPSSHMNASNPTPGTKRKSPTPSPYPSPQSSRPSSPPSRLSALPSSVRQPTPQQSPNNNYNSTPSLITPARPPVPSSSNFFTPQTMPPPSTPLNLTPHPSPTPYSPVSGAPFSPFLSQTSPNPYRSKSGSVVSLTPFSQEPPLIIPQTSPNAASQFPPTPQAHPSPQQSPPAATYIPISSKPSAYVPISQSPSGYIPISSQPIASPHTSPTPPIFEQNQPLSSYVPVSSPPASSVLPSSVQGSLLDASPLPTLPTPAASFQSQFPAYPDTQPSSPPTLSAYIPPPVNVSAPQTTGQSEIQVLDVKIAEQEEKVKNITNPLMKRTQTKVLDDLRAQRAKLTAA